MDDKKEGGGKFSTGKCRPERMEYLCDKWLKNYEVGTEKGAKAESRYRNLSTQCRDYIKPFFQGMDIRDIDRDMIEKFYHSLLDQGKSSRYIKDILNMLKSLLLDYRAGDMPEFPEFEVVSAKPKQLLDLTREIAIMDKVPIRNGYNIAVLILLRTGMRIGEISAIKVCDLADGVIYVSKAINHKSEIKNARKAGKPIPYRVSRAIWDLLQQHIQGKDTDAPVFEIEGRALSPRRLHKVWEKACEDAGVKYISLLQASLHSVYSKINKEHDKKEEEEVA
jgi:integrase